MSEDDYDSEIAPKLIALAERCKDLGMAFTATVEYAPGERGTTAAGIDKTNLDMLVPYLAGRTGGRLDDLLLSLARRLREQKLSHSCICLRPFLPCDPADR